MSDQIDLTLSDDDTVAESTILRDFNENRSYTYRSQSGVAYRFAYPNLPRTSVSRPSSRPLGEFGEENVDIDTLNEVGERMINPAEDSSSSDSSYGYDTAEFAECEGGYTSSIYILPNEVSAKQRRAARYQHFLRTGSWEGAPLQGTGRAAQNKRKVESLETEALKEQQRQVESTGTSSSLGNIMLRLEESTVQDEQIRTTGQSSLSESIAHQLADNIISVTDNIDNSSSIRRSTRKRQAPDRLVEVHTSTRKSQASHRVVEAVQCHVNQSLDPDLGEQSFLLTDPDDSSSVESKVAKEKIIDSPIRNENTCMFYGMYNSLRTEEERFAFADGNLAHPSKSFVEFHFNSNTSPEVRERIEIEGYTAEDMRQYLIELVRKGRIREYDWIVKKNWSLSNFFCGGGKNQHPGTWQLFGINVLTDQKPVARKRIKMAANKVHPSFVRSEQCLESLAFSGYYCKAISRKYKFPHGGVIQRDDKGNTFYYDTAKKYVHKNPTVSDLTEVITAIYKAVEFKIYLHGDPNHRKRRIKENRHKKSEERSINNKDK